METIVTCFSPRKTPHSVYLGGFLLSWNGCLKGLWIPRKSRQSEALWLTFPVISISSLILIIGENLSYIYHMVENLCSFFWESGSSWSDPSAPECSEKLKLLQVLSVQSEEVDIIPFYFLTEVMGNVRRATGNDSLQRGGQEAYSITRRPGPCSHGMALPKKRPDRCCLRLWDRQIFTHEKLQDIYRQEKEGVGRSPGVFPLLHQFI